MIVLTTIRVMCFRPDNWEYSGNKVGCWWAAACWFEIDRRTVEANIARNPLLNKSHFRRKIWQLIGDYIGVPFVRIEPKDNSEDILKHPKHIARQYNVVLFWENEDDIACDGRPRRRVGVELYSERNWLQHCLVFLATKSNILDCF